MRLFAVLDASPRLKLRFLELCNAIMDHVSPRLREIGALRTTAERDADYPFHGHGLVAASQGILAEHEIAAVAADDWGAFDLADAVVLQGVDELLRAGRLSPATQLALGPARAVDLTIVAGVYETIGRLTAGIEREPGPCLEGLDTPAAARAAHRAATAARRHRGTVEGA